MNLERTKAANGRKTGKTSNESVVSLAYLANWSVIYLWNRSEDVTQLAG